jgi:hypothetical protein
VAARLTRWGRFDRSFFGRNRPNPGFDLPLQTTGRSQPDFGVQALEYQKAQAGSRTFTCFAPLELCTRPTRSPDSRCESGLAASSNGESNKQEVSQHMLTVTNKKRPPF